MRILSLIISSLLLAGTVDAAYAKPREGSSSQASKQNADSKRALRGKVALESKGAKPERNKSKTASAERLQGKSVTVAPAIKLGRKATRAEMLAAKRAELRPVSLAPSLPSLGRQNGLHETPDPLDLASSAAIVVDQANGDMLYQKNVDAVLPIASITKLMTSLVTLEAKLPMGDVIELTEADIPPDKYRRSKLAVGVRLTRAELMQLALMASDNRAAYALGRHYPGGLDAFVQAMNTKAMQLGMTRSRFVEPTGLSSENVSTPRDLSLLVRAAYDQPLIRQYSTSTDLLVDAGGKLKQFHNTNRLVGNPDWEIGLSKTGFISAAGKCLVMQVKFEGRPTIVVLLDANGSRARLADAERVRRWLEDHRQSGQLQRTAPVSDADNGMLKVRTNMAASMH